MSSRVVWKVESDMATALEACISAERVISIEKGEVAWGFGGLGVFGKYELLYCRN